MKGILFKPEMIKAVVEGRKTQTRRVIKPHPSKSFVTKLQDCWAFDKDGKSVDLGVEFRVPRYKIGEIVYIKEAFTYVTLAEIDPWKDRAMKDGSFRRKPDGSPVTMCYKLDGYEIGSDWLNPRGMPAWAARYFIRITDVRAERLQEITLEDCWDEGIQVRAEDRIPTFKRLWDSLNAREYPWENNYWVWVISFKRQLNDTL